MRRAAQVALVFVALAAATALFRWLHLENSTSIALAYLTIVLLTAAALPLWVAISASVVSLLSFNFFFLEPVHTFTIADPQNWVALAAFTIVSLVASNLSARARMREREAVDRRDAMARLFDLGRDILMMTAGPGALPALAQAIVRRFDLQYVAICEPAGSDWTVASAGEPPGTIDTGRLADAMTQAHQRLEFDATRRVYAGHQAVSVGGAHLQLVPLRAGATVTGLLAASGRMVDAGTLDALGGLVALAMERARLLEDRRAAELARRSEDLKSALLASLSHDLRTPLTAIGVAAANLQHPMADADRQEQATLVLSEVDRLTRLFHNILEMARIDAGAIAAEQRWVHVDEIVDVARELVGPALAGHTVRLVAEGAEVPVLVKLDPRLTASALSHLLENAAQYSPPGSVIEVVPRISRGELSIAVLDQGPGLSGEDVVHVFDRFYRGRSKGQHAGSGMGLSIARGLLAVEGGRVWAENRPGQGATFTIAIPVDTRAESAEVEA
ncbi:MAG: DUF4118 domain-containing protein [Vicinamibacterales bacterium]